MPKQKPPVNCSRYRASRYSWRHMAIRRNAMALMWQHRLPRVAPTVPRSPSEGGQLQFPLMTRRIPICTLPMRRRICRAECAAVQVQPLCRRDSNPPLHPDRARACTLATPQTRSPCPSAPWPAPSTGYAPCTADVSANTVRKRTVGNHVVVAGIYVSAFTGTSLTLTQNGRPVSSNLLCRTMVTAPGTALGATLPSMKRTLRYPTGSRLE